MCLYELWVYTRCTSTRPEPLGQNPTSTADTKTHHHNYFLVKRCDNEIPCPTPEGDAPSTITASSERSVSTIGNTVLADRLCPGCYEAHNTRVNGLGGLGWPPVNNIYAQLDWHAETMGYFNMDGLRFGKAMQMEGTGSEGRRRIGMEAAVQGNTSDDRGRSWIGWDAFH